MLDVANAQSMPLTIINSTTSYNIGYRVELFNQGNSSNDCLPIFSGTSGNYMIAVGDKVKIQDVNHYEYPYIGSYVIESWCYNYDWLNPTICYGPYNIPPLIAGAPLALQSVIEWESATILIYDLLGNHKDTVIIGRSNCSASPTYSETSPSVGVLITWQIIDGEIIVDISE